MLSEGIVGLYLDSLIFLHDLVHNSAHFAVPTTADIKEFEILLAIVQYHLVFGQNVIITFNIAQTFYLKLWLLCVCELYKLEFIHPVFSYTG